jgi:hypothetical protein
VRQKIIYVNTGTVDVILSLEPWVDRYRIQPKQLVEIVVENADLTKVLELNQSQDRFIVYGYAGCVLKVLMDGREMTPIDE